jgi:hypothetical protein
MKSETTKQLIILAFVALAALVVWEIFKTIQKGEATFNKIIMAPFNGLASAWKAIKGLFSFGSGSSSSDSVVDPSSPLYPMTIGGVPINTLGNGLTIQPTGSQDMGFDNWLASIQ